jgi:hypothetical protein
VKKRQLKRHKCRYLEVKYHSLLDPMNFSNVYSEGLLEYESVGSNGNIE